MFSPDVIKIVSWMLCVKCVKKQFAYLGKRFERNACQLKQSCEEFAANVGIQYAVCFSNNGFFVGKPSKSYQPSQTSESCGTFDVDEICSILKYRKYIFLFDVGSLGSSLWDFFGGCRMLIEHMPHANQNYQPTCRETWLKIEKICWYKPMTFC